MKREIIIITSGGFKPHDVARALERRYVVRIVPVERTRDALRLGTYTIVIDVDLSDPETIAVLRASLAARAENVKYVFVVDGRRRASRVQALQLGADAVVLRPFSDNRMRQALEASRYQMSDCLDDAERAAVSMADDAMTHVFALTKRGGSAEDAHVVDQKTKLVVSAFDDIGMDRWLATMRAHHDGTYRHCLTVTGVSRCRHGSARARCADA
jgi:CheY-like chemotaxis protein